MLMTFKKRRTINVKVYLIFFELALYDLLINLEMFIHVYIGVLISILIQYTYTCQDAIQCRPWAPPPPIVYSQQTVFKYIDLFGILRKNYNVVSLFSRKLKTPFWTKNQIVPKCAVVAFFSETIVPHIQKRYK